MKQQSIVIFYYSLLVFIGGIIGYFVAGSQASLVASSLSAVLLLLGAIRIRQGCRVSYYLTTGIIALLCVFFTYRFFLSYKIAPGGMMAILSACLIAYLIVKRTSNN